MVPEWMWESGKVTFHVSFNGTQVRASNPSEKSFTLLKSWHAFSPTTSRLSTGGEQYNQSVWESKKERVRDVTKKEKERVFGRARKRECVGEQDVEREGRDKEGEERVVHGRARFN